MKPEQDEEQTIRCNLRISQLSSPELFDAVREIKNSTDRAERIRALALVGYFALQKNAPGGAPIIIERVSDGTSPRPNEQPDAGEASTTSQEPTRVSESGESQDSIDLANLGHIQF